MQYYIVLFDTSSMLELNCLEMTALKVLKQGHVPNHVGFIMDGNRRHAKNSKKQALSGHAAGANTLKRCLLYCLHLGVKHASFYAFSLENFKRTEEEVEYLMDLARKQFEDLEKIDSSDNIGEIVQRNNIKIRVIGDLEGQLKRKYPDVVESFLRLQEKTKNNTEMTLNICFAYDSVFEVNQAIQKASEKFEEVKQLKQGESQEQGLLKHSKLKEKERAVQDNLLITEPLDLLIRTSNEQRLSNFMLMQSRDALIEIEKQFWPAFNLVTMARILLKYNYHHPSIQARRERKSKGRHVQ